MKRKLSSYLSSPPPELASPKPPAEDLQQVQFPKAESPPVVELQEQDTQEASDEQLSAKIEYNGRGRSPYKTPVTAVIDQLKKDVRRLEHFDRALAQQRLQYRRSKREKEKEYASNWYALQDMGKSEGQKTAKSGEQNSSKYREQNPLANKPKLGPTPATPATGRSISPEKLLEKLQTCKPQIIREEFRLLSGQPREAVKEVCQFLLQGTRFGFIPTKFKVTSATSQLLGGTYRLQEIIQDEEFEVGDHAFGEMEDLKANSLNKMATKIKTEASICESQNRDENAWCDEVVRRLLKWEPHSPDQPRFTRIENIQSQMINEACLPMNAGVTVESKKADFALAISPDHPDNATQYHALNSVDVVEHFTLSQMNDTCTSKLVLYAGIEVKKASGDKTKALAQLITWLAAGIMKRRKLLSKANESSPTSPSAKHASTTPPLIGFLVHGHTWELFMAIGIGNNVDDKITILGPLRSLTFTTCDYSGCFSLLRLMENVKNWAQTKYWEWYVPAIIESLKGAEKSIAEIMEDNDMSDGDDA
ncbi:uncharacterized protein KY384_002910 [Bacidia gigantensis]|uniref:uncharacterized protein n=1 Tax=Bacidia gigantensis TaxID=2732470 RepID=UPI001D03D7C1|nr:uncharacterized protein KY384_002910 [Bacidia gigantensis]KAG8532425.1 hypothetical protein KY384_002910 [Bacidia gigantensis]